MAQMMEYGLYMLMLGVLLAWLDRLHYDWIVRRMMDEHETNMGRMREETGRKGRKGRKCISSLRISLFDWDYMPLRWQFQLLPIRWGFTERGPGSALPWLPAQYCERSLLALYRLKRVPEGVWEYICIDVFYMRFK